MEFLAFLYTVLLVAICLMMALLLYRSAKPAANRDDAERKEWLRQQLEAQNRQMDAKLAGRSSAAWARRHSAACRIWALMILCARRLRRTHRTRR